MAALLVTDLSQSLKVVVEHARMTDQTHLLRNFAVGGSDHRAAPRTDNVVCGFGVFKLVVELTFYVSAHVCCLNKSRSSLRTHPGINE